MCYLIIPQRAGLEKENSCKFPGVERRNTTDILLCALNSKYIHSALAPWYLKAALFAYAQAAHPCEVLEATVNEEPGLTLQKIVKRAPELLGLSCYIWNISRVRELLPLIRKELPSCRIILGGPEVSYNQEELLEALPEVDFILSGEGELPFARLCDALALGNPIPDNLGISYRAADGLRIAAPYLSREDPPSPYTPEYLQALKGRICYLETSRGCPFSCAFCLSGRCGGVRFFDLERSLKDMVALANSGTSTVKFVDRTFNANPSRAKKILRFLSANYGKSIPDTVCFHFEIAGDLLDWELLDLLRAAPKGSIQLEIGLQSFHPETLEAVTRKTDTEKLSENIRLLCEPGNLHIHIDLIAGLPQEDFAVFGKSFDKAYALSAHMLQLGFLKLLHGSPLEEDPMGCVFSPDPPYEVASTPWLSARELERLHEAERALDLLYCSGRFAGTVRLLIGDGSPFAFYLAMGELLRDVKTPMEACGVLLRYGERKGLDSQALRDTMVCDWLRKSPLLPPALRQRDGSLKHLALALDRRPETRRPPGVKRTIAILPSRQSAVYVDYIAPDRVTGLYPLHEMEDIGEKASL